MLTLLQISDLHFGPLYRPEVGEALLRAAADIRADVIVASGDFTQRAKAAEFASARAFLDRLPAPQIVVPGNHDIPLYRFFERLMSPHALYRQYISPELDTVLARDDATIVALNTTAPLRKITDGQIKPWQLDFARRAFEATPPQAARIVVAHHHFAPAPDSQRKCDATLGAQAALDCFSQLGVDLILGGHLHRSYTAGSYDAFPPADVAPTSDRHSSSGDVSGTDGLPQTGGVAVDGRAAEILIVECGTSTSSRGRGRERGRNSINVIQIDDRTTTVTHWLFSPSVGDFAPASRHTFPRRGKRFSTPPSS